MGNPQFRFTLSHAINGTLEITEPIGWSTAILKLERHEDFHSLVEYFEGAFTFYGSDGGSVNGGIEWIKSTETQFGFDTEIVITIEVSFDEGETFESIFIGQLDLTGAQELKDNKMEIPIIRNSLWSNFIARQDVPVNIQSTTDLDGNSITPLIASTIHLTSQKLNKKYSGYMSRDISITLAASDYMIIEYDVEDFDEITQKFTYTISNSPTLPFEKFNLDFGGLHKIKCNITLGQGSMSSNPASTISYLDIYLQINGAPVQLFDKVDRAVSESGNFNDSYTSGTGGGAYSITGTVTDYSIDVEIPNLKKSDAIRIYARNNDSVGHPISIYGKLGYPTTINAGPLSPFEGYWSPSTGLFPTTAPLTGGFMLGRSWLISEDGTLQGVPVLKGWTIRSESATPGQTLTNWYIGVKGLQEDLYRLGETYLTVIAETDYPSTTADGFLIHDVGHSACDRITGQSNSFYSEVLGSNQTSISYSDNGCLWKNLLIQGLQIRGYYLSTKQFSISFDKWWKGANPLFNLGIGYDTINDVEVIRCEGKEFFYDKTSVSVYIDNVREIIREYDATRIWNKFEFGNTKWESENISGIDDPQTKRTWTDIIKKIKNTFTMYSEFVAASYAIETTRRTTIKQSADYKYDNDIFIIAITGDPVSPDRYDPELNENFDSVNNLFNPETRYNLALTPMRSLLRWGNYLSGCLQKYLTTSFKFVSGEGNYSMTSDYNFTTGEECIGVLNGVLSEREDIPVSSFTPIHLPDLFTITIDLSWDDYLSIRQNRTLSIGVSQTETGHKKFFIKTLEYTICKSQAKITMWAAESAQINIIDTVQNVIDCQDPNLRITEDSKVRKTEDGIDRIV